MPRTLRAALAGVVGWRLDMWLTAGGDHGLISQDETVDGISPLGDGASPPGAVRSDRGAPVTAAAGGLAHHARERRADPRGASGDEPDRELDRALRPAGFPWSPGRADRGRAVHDGVAGVASALSGCGAGVRHDRRGRGV